MNSALERLRKLRLGQRLGGTLPSDCGWHQATGGAWSSQSAELPKVDLAQSPTIGPEDLPPDWQVEWEERAAIMEFDGGLPRERAEAEAMKCVIRQMRGRGVSLGKPA